MLDHQYFSSMDSVPDLQKYTDPDSGGHNVNQKL